MNIQKLKRLYDKEQYNPGIPGIFINPYYFARKELHKNISELAPQIKGKVLDIGCGVKPYKSLCNASEYLGLEIDSELNRKSKNADFFYDGHKMPFENATFDGILANQVFEHVFNPREFLLEVNRILKTGGQFLITVPFVWDEHEQPYDFARYSSFGLVHCLKEAGFEILEHRKSNNGIGLIFQLLNAYLYKITELKNPYLNLFRTIILLAPVNILGILLSFILPKNDDLYLDNIVLARKVKDV